MGAQFDEDELAIRTPALDVVGADVVAGDPRANGRALALEDAVELARSGPGRA